MAQAIVSVLVLIIIVAYAVFFSFWNPEIVNVTSFEALGTTLSGDVALWLLPLAGLAVGAIVMALAMWTPWSSMKRTLAAGRERLGVEQERSQDLAKKLKALRQRLDKFRTQPPAAQEAEGATELPDDA